MSTRIMERDPVKPSTCLLFSQKKFTCNVTERCNNTTNLYQKSNLRFSFFGSFLRQVPSLPTPYQVLSETGSVYYGFKDCALRHCKKRKSLSHLSDV